MSNDEKRSGIRDIRTLRERLGKVKQGASANESPERAAGSIIPPPEGGAPTGPSDKEEVSSKPVGPDAEAGGASTSAEPAKPTVPASTAGEAQFAHPLQVGQYNQARPSLEVTAADLQEIEEYEKKHSGRRKVIISIAVVCLIGGLGFGYLSGSAMDARKRHNVSVQVASDLHSTLDLTITNIGRIDEAIQAEISRMEANQSKLQAAVKKFKGAKANQKLSKLEKAQAIENARGEIRTLKAVQDAGIQFQIVSTKLPEELVLNTQTLLQKAQFLPATSRQQLASFLIETDRCFRLVGQYQQTASAISKLQEAAAKRFGPVLAVNLGGGAADPSFQNLPNALQRGQILRFNRGFVDAISEKPLTKLDKNIAILGLATPDGEGELITSSKQIVALSTRAAVDVATQVYPVIRTLLMVQFQELEELSKSLKASSAGLKASLETAKSRAPKFTL